MQYGFIKPSWTRPPSSREKHAGAVRQEPWLTVVNRWSVAAINEFEPKSFCGDLLYREAKSNKKMFLRERHVFLGYENRYSQGNLKFSPQFLLCTCLCSRLFWTPFVFGWLENLWVRDATFRFFCCKKTTLFIDCTKRNKFIVCFNKNVSKLCNQFHETESKGSFLHTPSHPTILSNKAPSKVALPPSSLYGSLSKGRRYFALPKSS